MKRRLFIAGLGSAAAWPRQRRGWAAAGGSRRAVARPAARQMSFADLELLRQGVRLEPLLQVISNRAARHPQ
jgi:hypothetical protein